MNSYFKHKNRKSENRLQNHETLNTIIELVETIVIFGATSTSTTLSITAIGLV